MVWWSTAEIFWRRIWTCRSWDRIADFVPLIGFSWCVLSVFWGSAMLLLGPNDSNAAHLLWTLTQSPTLSTFIITCGVLTSALSLRCRKWLFWSITYKSGIMDINPIKVKEYLKTYGIKNHFKSLNEAIFKTNLRLITSKVLFLFPASFLQEHGFLVIHLSFCVFDTVIKSIIQSPHVAKVHLLPAKSSAPARPQRQLQRGPALINLPHFLWDVRET